MRRDLVAGLLGWIAIAIALSAVAGAVAGVDPAETAFLLLPAGVLVALVVNAVRHYVGDPVGSPDD